MRTILITAALIAVFIGVAMAQQTGTFTDGRDGKTYKTVRIGGYAWMAENLNYQTDSGSWCYRNNADNCKKYGRLYDWETAMAACPAGWRLSSDADWGWLKAMADGGEYKGTAGKRLKSKSGWNKQNNGRDGNGTDDFGFSALPGGTVNPYVISDNYNFVFGIRYSYDDSRFEEIGEDGVWWTSTECCWWDDDCRDDNDGYWRATLEYDGCCYWRTITEYGSYYAYNQARNRVMSNSHDGVAYKTSNYKSNGHSVRCVSDKLFISP